MIVLDHILWAAPDLDAGARLFERLTGVTPAGGGAHPGFGTRNSLAGLGDDVYFEVIAPDPAQDLTGNRGGTIAELKRPGLLTFALRTTDIPAFRAAAEAAGLACQDPVSMSRTRPDGVRLDWSILYPRHPSLGTAVPFAIDWGRSPHPSGSVPQGCRLKSLVALAADPDPLAAIFEALGAPVEVRRGTPDGFVAVLDTPRGEVVLTSA